MNRSNYPENPSPWRYLGSQSDITGCTYLGNPGSFWVCRDRVCPGKLRDECIMMPNGDVKPAYASKFVRIVK